MKKDTCILAVSASVAAAIADGTSTEQLEKLAVFLTAVADQLVLIAVFRDE